MKRDLIRDPDFKNNPVNMTSFEHQKNSAPHHLLEALTPVSYTYGFIDFCWIKSINTFNIQNIN